MAETEAGNLPAWAQYGAGIAGFATLVYLTVKGVIQDRAKARQEDRGKRNSKRIRALDTKFTAVEETQKRLIELLKDENKELRDRYDAAVLRHNTEVVELRTELAALRAQVNKAAEESRRRQEDYDRSRVEIHTLRTELAVERGKNEVLSGENAELKAKNDELLAKQTPPTN